MKANTNDSICTLTNLLSNNVIVERVLVTENHAIIMWVTWAICCSLSRRCLIVSCFMLLCLDTICRLSIYHSCLIDCDLSIMHVLSLSLLKLWVNCRSHRNLRCIIGSLILIQKFLCLSLRLLIIVCFYLLLVSLLDLFCTHEKSLHSTLRYCACSDLPLCFLIFRVGSSCSEFECMLSTKWGSCSRANVQESALVSSTGSLCWALAGWSLSWCLISLHSFVLSFVFSLLIRVGVFLDLNVALLDRFRNWLLVFLTTMWAFLLNLKLTEVLRRRMKINSELLRWGIFRHIKSVVLHTALLHGRRWHFRDRKSTHSIGSSRCCDRSSLLVRLVARLSEHVTSWIGQVLGRLPQERLRVLFLNNLVLSLSFERRVNRWLA